MLLLIAIGFGAGIITAISPCVLPVLPIVLAGGAAGGRRRPYAIIGGLVASFSLFTLFAAWILDRLGLPQDLLRDISIGLLFFLAATLVFPKLAELAERPFLFLTRRRSGDLGGGFLLGASLGLVFVPCAGPVLGVITTQAARLDFGWRTVALTLAYALGAAVPMLLIATRGQAVSRRLRAHAGRTRVLLGVAMAGAALAITFSIDQKLQTWLPDYTSFLQDRVESNSAAQDELRKLRGGGSRFAARQRAASAATLAKAPARETYRAPLPDLGAAPDFHGISHWLNTAGERPLSLARLRGKVVLVDFWTYSCINCLRTLPHLKAWDRAYRHAGLVIVGVHTPEFAFEHELGNVRGATKRLGVRYPVALDNNFDTWNAWQNEYWPAEYLIDARGRVRHVHFGEGEYERSEAAIRALLREAGASPGKGAAVRDATPAEAVTPETYLGASRIDRYVGKPLREGRIDLYRFPATLRRDAISYAGRWRIEHERAVADLDARLRLHFRARNVFVVLGGNGTVGVRVDGRRTRTLRVDSDRLYTVFSAPRLHNGILELRFSRGVDGYAFTFG